KKYLFLLYPFLSTLSLLHYPLELRFKCHILKVLKFVKKLITEFPAIGGSAPPRLWLSISGG
ncbi:hypothetical protein, partial [Phocaeicola vulgatus]|uniref:hypothetical protein n=3 Tax=Bacteroidales TaxID=171549 RepID=UPI0034A16815